MRRYTSPKLITLFLLISTNSFAEYSLNAILKSNKGNLSTNNWNQKFNLKDAPIAPAISKIDAVNIWKDEKGKVPDWILESDEIYHFQNIRDDGDIFITLTKATPLFGGMYEYRISTSDKSKKLVQQKQNICIEEVSDLQNTLGTAEAITDRSQPYSDKMQLMHTSAIDASWRLKDTRIKYSCLAISSINLSTNESKRQLIAQMSNVTIGSQTLVKKIKPISVLKCEQNSTTYFSNGETSNKQNNPILLGIDENNNEIINASTKETIARKIQVNEFEVIGISTRETEDFGIVTTNININRVDGTFNSVTEAKSKKFNASATHKINGKCSKLDISHRTF